MNIFGWLLFVFSVFFLTFPVQSDRISLYFKSNLELSINMKQSVDNLIKFYLVNKIYTIK